jgi:hypothetical protein
VKNQRAETGKNVRTHARNMARKAKRRAEADARNANWRSLTAAQKIADLDARGHVAKRQRARIQAAM